MGKKRYYALKDPRRKPLLDRKSKEAPLGLIPKAILVSSEFTLEKGRKVITYLKQGLHADTGASLVGITRKVLEEWLREGAQILDASIDQDVSNMPERERNLAQFVLDMDKAVSEMEVENIRYIKGARKQWWQAAAWLMERRLPKKWGRNDKVTVDDNRPPVSNIDAKILITTPEGAKAIGDVFRALAGGQKVALPVPVKEEKTSA